MSAPDDKIISAPTPDSAQIAVMLRAMAPDSYDAALRALRFMVLGLGVLIAGIIAMALSSAGTPAGGLVLTAFVAPLLLARWWQVGLVGRRILIVALFLAGALLLAAAVALLVGASFVAAALLLLAVGLLSNAGRLALRAWRALGPMRAMLSPAMIKSVVSARI